MLQKMLNSRGIDFFILPFAKSLALDFQQFFLYCERSVIYFDYFIKCCIPSFIFILAYGMIL